ncbi:MAG: hypothetical protein WCH21_08425 [Bacteroidota bacterium]
MKFNFSKYSFSEATLKKPSVIFLIFVTCFSFFFVDLFKIWDAHKSQHNFRWDIFNYYCYLPYKFCNNNSFEFVNDSFDANEFSGSGFIPRYPDGKLIPKATYGMSVMYAPFFVLAYKIAYNQGSPLTGFSEPFATCVHWGSVFYVIFGLFFLRKFLLNFFNEWVTTITLSITFFGTMLFVYTYNLSEMSHGYLFFLFSVFLYLIPKWHAQQKFIYTVLIGISIGLISLIRPTEIIVFVFFVFWNVRTLPELKEKFRFFLKNYLHIIIIGVIGVLLWIPQFIFWKNQTGNYFFFSYPGERFFWNDPQIINILFSYRKGWVTYTPVIITAFIGFFFIKKDFPLSKWVLISVTCLFVYVLSCWWDWFFGGCFGARGFCQHIAFLSIPIAFFIQFVFYTSKKYIFKPIISLLTIVFLASCICLNLAQSYQYVNRHIHPTGMSKETYWYIFGKFYYDQEDDYKFWGTIKAPDYDKLKSGEDREQ